MCSRITIVGSSVWGVSILRIVVVFVMSISIVCDVSDRVWY